MAWRLRAVYAKPVPRPIDRRSAHKAANATGSTPVGIRGQAGLRVRTRFIGFMLITKSPSWLNTSIRM